MTIREAWRATPGPVRPGQALMLAAKGFLMGSADIVPGVSGGTMAFITGIYDDLIAAVRSVSPAALGRLLRLDFSGALSLVHARFLLALLSGLVLAVFSLARLLHHLLLTHPAQVWALFFGLIAASVVVVGRKARWSPGAVAAGLAGAAFSWLLVGLVPVQTPETWWFVLLCGSLAICAMILPGISGAYILLLLGKYEYVTGALKDPLSPDSLAIILVFVAGAVVGVMVFSRVLGWFLANWHNTAMAVLTGFMAGAMRKVWPWKEILDSRMVGNKLLVLREANVFPDGPNPEILACLGLMLAGAALVLAVEWLAGRGGPSETA